MIKIQEDLDVALKDKQMSKLNYQQSQELIQTLKQKNSTLKQIQKEQDKKISVMEQELKEALMHF